MFSSDSYHAQPGYEIYLVNIVAGSGFSKNSLNIQIK